MVITNRQRDESEASNYWVRNESRSNEVCSPSKSPYIPQAEYQK